MSTKMPKISVKRGDDFRLDITVQDLNSDDSLTAKANLEATRTTYDAAIAATPQIPSNIAAAQNALTNAQTAYDLAIKVDISLWTISSSLAWAGKLISTFVVTKTDPRNGVFSVRLPSTETALWKPRVYEADIQFVRPEGRISSKTFQISVERDVANG